MEIGPKSVHNPAGDPARHGPEHGRRITGSRTDSVPLVFGMKPIDKMFFLYLGVAVFLCLPNSIHSVPAYHEQSLNNVDTQEGILQDKYEQYYHDSANTRGEKTLQRKSLQEKLQERLSTTKHDRVKSKPVTLKAEITLGLREVKDFVHNLVKDSMSVHETPSRRSTRDTEPQMGAAADSDGPWISNLSPAAVVGTIVGGTIGVFLIVVLTVIFCSYRNYSSLEIRQRTADVYGGNGYPQAERRM